MAKDFTPRYYEIEQALREIIARSQPSDPLPSESELCAQFNVSRMTARHAMQRLVQEGLIYRVTGRGSFVAMPHVHRQANTLTSFTAEMTRRGKTPSSRIVRAEVTDPTPEDRASLRLPRGAPVVIVERVRLADGIPVARERAAFPERCRPVLDADLKTGSLHQALLELGTIPTRGRATLTSTAATERDAELLDVDEGRPLLVERRIIRDQRDEPLEYTESRYAGDRYLLEVNFDVEKSGS